MFKISIRSDKIGSGFLISTQRKLPKMKIKYLTLLVIFALLFSACIRETKVSGEIFAQNNDGDARKFAAVSIKFVKKTQVDEIKARGEKPEFNQLAAEREVKSDSDGKFEVVLPRGEYVVFAKHRYRGEYSEIVKSWEVNILLNESEKKVSLNSTNARNEFVLDE